MVPATASALRRSRRPRAFAALAAAALAGPAALEARIAQAADKEVPIITPSPPPKPAPGRVRIPISVYDESKIFAVWFHWRPAGTREYRQIEPIRRGALYLAELETQEPFEFWVEAYDVEGNGPGLAGSAAQPLRVELRGPDTQPPAISHRATLSDSGDEFELKIRIEDESAVFAPALTWRAQGDAAWQRLELSGSGHDFEAVLPAARDVEFWLEAYDEKGNGPSTEGSDAHPFVLRAKDLAPPALADLAPEAKPAVEVPPAVPAPAPRPAVPSLRAPWSYVAMGAGAAAAIAAGAFYLRARGAAEQWRTATTDAGWRDGREGTDSALWGVRGSLVGSALLLGGGGLLYFREF